VSGISTHDVETLRALFERTDWKEIRVSLGDSELFLSKDGRTSLSAAAPAPVARATVHAEAAKSAAPAPAAPTGIDVPPGWRLVTASSLGTFYRALKPGAPALTEIGARVTADSELCLIEVMKLFTTMRAGASGTIREIYVQDGQLVEFKQPLFLIEPDA